MIVYIPFPKKASIFYMVNANREVSVVYYYLTRFIRAGNVPS